MLTIPMKTKGAYNSRTILEINLVSSGAAGANRTQSQLVQSKPQPAQSRPQPTQSRPQPAQSRPQPVQSRLQPAQSRPQPVLATPIREFPIPELMKPLRKGQKVPLETGGTLQGIEARLGWNVKNEACDLDVSAFLLGRAGKVIGDDWFVFYGQTKSPDGSTVFYENSGADREMIKINFSGLDPRVQKIVFVLTINEAVEKRLNFSMIKDAYIRIMDSVTQREIVSFKMDEYYENVTSMMIGEVYRHNGQWKFNAVGNGVARDLRGLCELYGVEVL